ncbi:hypothetical protein BB560_001949 [Smittium megazygosporum]|uniref:Uncharacterized protein n=1 Tax=Smittium megazygosporum TaxID=133381 RepID=A0A2T9ZG75_9FUNG|nr:hypothetical protein BB560_001949 [Smittium megazygosporum]
MESAELPLLENVRKMHSACKSRPGISSSVLALVSQVYTIEQLKDFGFEFSSNQYSLSRKKASDENFTLVDYERHSPTSKTKVSDKTKAKVSDILYEFSNISSSTISLDTAGNGYQEIRYLTKPKRDIYYELKKRHPGIQLSLTIEQRRNFKDQIAGLSEFEEVNLWSDSGPHFKNADYLYSLRLELPQIFSSKKSKLNYFMGNHGKSGVDGRKHKHLEIYLITVGYITSRYIERMPSVTLGSDLSLPDPSKYFNIDFRIKVKQDAWTNKYAPDRSNPLGSDTDIMGSTSRNTQRIRVEMLRGIGVSLSI